MITTRLRDHLCPWCGTLISAASGASRAPAAGDLSVCVYCAGPVVFGPGLTVEKLTEREFARLPDALRVKLRAAMRSVDLNPLPRSGDDGGHA